MIKAYAISLKKKFMQRDLTVELYGCNIKCRHCCSAFGRRRPARYAGIDRIFERALSVYQAQDPQIIRFTGGEFSLNGKEAIALYLRLARAVDIPIVIETNMTSIGFYEEFAAALEQSALTPPIFIVSIKRRNLVIQGRYSTRRVVDNIRRLYTLFPDSYIAHGFIGHPQSFQTVLLRYFPELGEHTDQIRLQREGRFTFESLMVEADGRNLYYFDQKIKKYRVLQRG